MFIFQCFHARFILRLPLDDLIIAVPTILHFLDQLHQNSTSTIPIEFLRLLSKECVISSHRVRVMLQLMLRPLDWLLLAVHLDSDLIYLSIRLDQSDSRVLNLFHGHSRLLRYGLRFIK